jgi:alkylhydroperoxidase family enzyme
MTWLRTESAGATPFDRVLGLRAEALRRFAELRAALAHGGVDPETLERCRERVDALVRCRPDPTGGRLRDEAQRAAVAYAEQYALDPHGLRDADFERLHQHFSDAQIAALTLAVAVSDAQARFTVALEAE